MDYTDKLVEEIVEYCGGDKKLIKNFKNKINSQKIITIEDLIRYKNKNHFKELLKEDDAPMFYKYIIDGYYLEPHEVNTLEDILSYIDDLFDEKNENIEFIDGGKYSDKDLIIEELIKLKFGSIQYS